MHAVAGNEQVVGSSIEVQQCLASGGRRRLRLELGELLEMTQAPRVDSVFTALKNFLPTVDASDECACRGFGGNRCRREVDI